MLCQEVVAAALKPHMEQGLQVFHYMDDILIWDKSSIDPATLKDRLIPSLETFGFKIAHAKVQMIPPIHFLGTKISLTAVRLLKPILSLLPILTLTSISVLPRKS